MPYGNIRNCEPEPTWVCLAGMTVTQPPRSQPGRNVTRLCCGQRMNLVKTVPRVGSYPELQTYRCEKCHHVETIELE